MNHTICNARIVRTVALQTKNLFNKGSENAQDAIPQNQNAECSRKEGDIYLRSWGKDSRKQFSKI